MDSNHYKQIYEELEDNLIKSNINIISDKEVEKKKPHIGEGSFGKVYKGIYNGKEVAIKKLKLDQESNAFDILNEINSVKLCEHKKIPKFLGLWKNSKNYFNLVFEFINGTTIDKCLNTLKEEEKHKIILEVCEVLVDIHKVKLIHRDLKPGNIMVDKKGGILDMHLIDFGTSKIALHAVSQTQTQRGTVAYMAPENFCVNVNSDNEGSIDISTKFDVWSMACLIVFILTGIKPWNGKPDSFVISNITSKRKYPLPKSISGDIADVLKLCFVYDPKERITSSELLEKLKIVFAKK